MQQENNIKGPRELLHVVSYWSYDTFDSLRHAYEKPIFHTHTHTNTHMFCALRRQQCDVKY